MDFKAILDRLTEQLKRLNAGLTTGQKIGIGVTSFLVLVGLLVLVALASRTEWRPVFTRLDPQDSASIVDRLTLDGVPFKLSHEGTTVMVPAEQVHEVRLQLTAPGRAAGGA